MGPIPISPVPCSPTYRGCTVLKTIQVPKQEPIDYPNIPKF